MRNVLQRHLLLKRLSNIVQDKRDKRLKKIKIIISNVNFIYIYIIQYMINKVKELDVALKILLIRHRLRSVTSYIWKETAITTIMDLINAVQCI